jgi:hypothetical protein
MKFKIFQPLFWLVFFVLGCSSKAENPEVRYSRETGEPVEGIRIAWDYSSMQKLAPQGQRFAGWAGYPRVRKLNDGTLMAVYDIDGNGEMVQSKDRGKTWSSPVVTFKQHSYTNTKGESTDVNIANSELCQLKNGDLVMACNYRPAKNEIAPFAIAIRRSSDMGQTWTDDQIIFEAQPRFIDGCWEPSFLQLPNGELQVYFANEAPFTTSDEQNISMLSSPDNGKTWTKDPKTVSFRANRRDGMPVALLVDDEILVSVEDNNIDQFKPYIVRSTVSNNWSSPVLANSPNREYALKAKMPDAVYAGAPYIMRVPTGEVILSYQTTSGRSSNWEMSTMEVAVGDKRGRNFEKLTRPFDVPLTREAKWNSISLWDENTIVAAATTSFRSANCEVWIINGHIIPELKITPAAITVDGNISEPEWGAEFPVFIGHQSETNLTASIRYNNENLCFAAKVNDQNLVSDSKDMIRSDGVCFYIDTENQNLLSPDAGIFKVACNYKGETKIWEGHSGQWEKLKSAAIQAKAKTVGNGYQLELSVPFSVLKKQSKSDFRINCGLVEYSSASTGYEENVANSSASSSNTWLHVKFQ